MPIIDYGNGNAEDIQYSVGLNSKKFDKGQSNVNNQFRKMKISADQFGKSGVMSLSTMAVGAGGAVIAFKAFSEVIDLVNVGIEKFNAQQKAEATLAQTLKSTGYAAGLTAFEIKNMASELQLLTTYGDEAIIASSSLLLTFKNIGEDVFPEAQKAILDVSAAMGQDLKTSSVQVGKALNDPIAGMTAMARVGITFTDTQKELVKGFVEVNDIASAQSIILTELESQFGGVAEAQAKTFEGINKQLGNYWGDIQESIGEGFTDEMTEPIQNLLDSLVDASPELASLAKSFGSIAGSLISVPTNALTGWIDLFSAQSAGTSKAEKNPFIKASIEAQENLDKALKDEYLGMGQLNYKDREKAGITDLASFKSVMESFRKLSDDELIKVSEAHENLVKRFLAVDPLYNNLIQSRKNINNAIVSGELLGTSDNLKAKGADLGGNTGSAAALKTKNLSEFDYMYDFDGKLVPDSTAAGMFSMGSNLGSTAFNQQSYGDVSTRLLGGQDAMTDIDEKINTLTLSLLDSDANYHAEMLEQNAKFYQDSISILDSSNDTIIGFHEALTSGNASGILGGLSGGVGGISGILGTLGLVDPSGISGILSGALNIGSTIAGFFGGGDSSSSLDDTSNVSSGVSDSTSSRTQIVSSAPENIYQTNNFNYSGCIVDEATTKAFVEKDIAPTLTNATRGVLT